MKGKIRICILNCSETCPNIILKYFLCFVVGVSSLNQCFRPALIFTVNPDRDPALSLRTGLYPDSVFFHNLSVILSMILGEGYLASDCDEQLILALAYNQGYQATQ
jgi:hypothetical protein